MKKACLRQRVLEELKQYTLDNDLKVTDVALQAFKEFLNKKENNTGLYIDSLTKHVTTNIITKTFKCDSCGHFWRPTLWLLQNACPNCRSPYWDTPRKK